MPASHNPNRSRAETAKLAFSFSVMALAGAAGLFGMIPDSIYQAHPWDWRIGWLAVLMFLENPIGTFLIMALCAAPAGLLAFVLAEIVDRVSRNS